MTWQKKHLSCTKLKNVIIVNHMLNQLFSEYKKIWEEWYFISRLKLVLLPENNECSLWPLIWLKKGSLNKESFLTTLIIIGRRSDFDDYICREIWRGMWNPLPENQSNQDRLLTAPFPSKYVTAKSKNVKLNEGVRAVKILKESDWKKFNTNSQQQPLSQFAINQWKNRYLKSPLKRSKMLLVLNSINYSRQ